MKSLRKVALAGLRLNKKRSAATIIAIALSCALIFTIIGLITSIYNLIYTKNVEANGNYHEMYQEVPGDKVSIIENYEGIKQIWYSDPVVFSDSGDYGYWGREAYETNWPEMPYEPSLYTLSDTLDESKRNADTKVNVFVKYEDPNQQESIHRKIYYQFLEDYDLEINIRINENILALDGKMTELSRLLMTTLALCVGGSLIIASVLMTRNSFQIAMMERLHQFGILASLGARPRQIRRLLYFEAATIAAIAIPLGLIIGLIATFILLLIINSLLGKFADFEIIFSMPPLAILVVAAMGALIVYLSSASAAIIAARMAPIDAIRNTNEIKIKKNRKIKTSKFIKSYFGIGGVIASNNLKRNRSRYRTTVLSIIVSVAIFIGFSTLVDISFREITANFGEYEADYTVYYAPAEMYDDIIEKFKPTQALYFKSTGAVPYERSLQVYDRLSGYAKSYSIYFVDHATFDKLARSKGIKSDDYNKVAILVDNYSEEHSDGGKGLKKLGNIETNKEYKFVAQVYRQKNIHNGDEPDIPEEERIDEDGNIIPIEDFIGEDGSFWDVDSEDIMINIAATTADPLFSVGYEEAPYLIASYDYYQIARFGIDGDPTQMSFQYNTELRMETGDNGQEITDYVDSIIKSDPDRYQDVYISDTKSALRVIRNIVTLLGIFLYGFITVISLIGLMNIFNTISTNVILRAKEFAMLKSVGMTTKEFNRMIWLESFFYCLRALCFGIPIGLIISYGIYYTFTSSGFDVGYMPPLLQIAISIVVVSAAVSLVMLYGVHEINKQNIIETIRKDSI